MENIKLQLIKRKRQATNGKTYYNYYVVVNGLKIAIQPVIYEKADKHVKYLNLKHLDAFATEVE